MHDIDVRLGAAVADLVRAGRVLDPEWLAHLLDNVAAETEAALLEHEARRKGAKRRARTTGAVIPFPGAVSENDVPPHGPANEGG